MGDENDDLDVMFDDENTKTTEEPTEAPVETPEKPEEPAPKEEEKPAETEEEKPAEESDKPEEKSEEQPAEEPAPADEQKPLTADEVRAIITDLKSEEYSSSKVIEETEKKVLEAYYPQGLSNVLVDEKTGKEIRTPQDVVDLSDGEMSIEQASQWLMNEQYKLDRQVEDIKKSARELAEVNANFNQGTARVVEKYKPIFDKYPALQEKLYKGYMSQVKVDDKKDLILSAPDIEEWYGLVMEPYVMAFNYQAPQAPAETTTEEKPTIPETKQTAKDRMDVSGDGTSGGDSDEADPNDPEANLNNLFGE